MIKDAETFKASDKEFTAKHEAKQELEAYIASVESTITGPEAGLKMKRGAKANVETELAKALEKLEIEESSTDELKRAHLHLRRAMQKALSGGR